MIAMSVSAAASLAVTCSGLRKNSLRGAPAAKSGADRTGQIMGGEPPKLDSRYSSSTLAVTGAAGSAGRSLVVISSEAAERTMLLVTSFGSSSNRHEVLSGFAGAALGAFAVVCATSLRNGCTFGLA